MPIFELDGKKYDVEDRHLDSFATKYPDAYTVGEKDGKKWKVRAKNYNRFLNSSTESVAKEDAPVSSENKPQSEPYTHVYGSDGSLIGGTALQEAGKPREVSPEVTERILANKPDYFKPKRVDFVYGAVDKDKSEFDLMQEGRLQELQNIRRSRPITEFGEAFEQGSDALYQGAKNLVGETANILTGSQRDYERAKRQLNELVESGYDLTDFDAKKALKAYKDRDFQRKMGEWQKEIATRKEEREDMGFFESLLHRIQDPSRPRSQYEETGMLADEIQLERSYHAIQDALRKSNGNVVEAYKLLGEKASKETWGDEVTREAREKLAEQRPTEGFGAWVGGMIPQMVGNVGATVARFTPWGRWLTALLGYGNMAYLTGATSGMSMAEARDYAQRKGMEANEGEVWRTGMADAAIEYATEKVPFNRYFGNAVDGSKKVVGKLIADAVGRNDVAASEMSDLLSRASKEFGAGIFSSKNIKNYLLDVGTEGLSEFTAEALQTITPMIYQNPEDYPTLKQIWDSGIEGAKGGLFMGAFLGAGNRFANRYQDRKRREEKGEVTFAETSEGIFEVLGINGDGKIVGQNSDGEQILLNKEEVIEQASMPYEDFKQASMDKAQSDAEERIQADNASIDAVTDTQTGNYAQVTAILTDGLGGTKEVVGNVVGWIGDSPIFVADGMENTEENRKVLKQGEWNPETLITRPAEEVKAINEDIIREEVAAQAERESKYAPEVLNKQMEQGIPFETADAIYLPIQPMAEGNGWTVEVQPKATNNKTASKSEVIELTNDEFYDLLQADLAAQEAVQAEIAQSESVGEQVNTPVNTEVNNPIENTESTPMPEEVQSATEEKSTQPQAEQPKQPTLEEVVATLPKNKKGEIDYKSMTHQQQYQYTSLTESPEVALEDLQADIAAGQEEIAKKQEQLSKARGGERAALRDEVRKLTQAQAELQSFYDSVASNVEEAKPTEEMTEPTAQEEVQPTEAPTQVEAVEEVVSEEEQRRRPLRERAKEWSDALGVDVTIYESVDDIEDEAVRQQVNVIHNSKKLAPGWVTDGKVYFLMSDMADVDEIDNTYIHEVVAHIGMEKLLGKERFAELCDKVWDMMPQSAKDYFYNYPEVSNVKDETARRRKAADEYIASLAEKENLTPEEQTIWDSIVKMFRDMLDRALNGIIGKSKLTNEDISNLIKASYANLKSGTEGSATNIEGSRMRAVERIEENVGEVDAEKGDVRSAVRDILKGEERKQAIKDLMEVTGRSKKTVEKWLEAEESLASVILNEDNVGILDMEADESVPSIWKNSDYPQGTVEFSNICKKRLPFTTIYQRLQKEFPNTLFDAQTLNTIRNTMKEMGEDVACALCFVEDRRQLLGEIGQGFIDAVKGMDVELNDNQKTALDKLRESGDKYVPNLFDIITLDGMKELRKKHPAVAQAFVEYNNARGMQSGRLFQAYSAYNREILKYNKKKVEGINNNGGLRIFSFSDFEAHHLIDLVQVLTDCAAKGIKVQGYTKVPEFAKAVKDTNAKINRSLIPKGVGYVYADYVPKEGEAVSPNVINGKRLLFDTVEGIDVNNPNFFDSTNSKSVGNILVAINDEHARLAMADPFVDYIIGFHTGQSKAILKGKGIDTWVNYKNEQLDKEIVTDEKGNQKMKNAPKHGLNIYTDVLNVSEAEGNPIKTAKQFTERFIEECNKRGWIPRFHRFLNRAKDGRFLYTPGYHKFLIDFKLFDKNGKILPQEAVVPIFDNEFNKQILDDYVKGVKEEMPNDAVYEAVKEAIGLGKGTRFKVVYHGSAADFDKFDRNFSGSGEGQAVMGAGHYVTTSEGTGRYYAEVASDMRRKVVQEGGYTYNGKVVRSRPIVSAYEALKRNGFDVDKAIESIERGIALVKRIKGENANTANSEESLKLLKEEKAKNGTLGYQEEIVEKPERHLYEVEIPDDNGKNYFDLDKKATKKTKDEAKKRLLNVLDNSEEGDYWKKNRDIIEDEWRYNVNTPNATNDSVRATMEQFLTQEEVADILSDMGYVGSKSKATDGTTYIIYNDDSIEIKSNTRFRISNKNQEIFAHEPAIDYVSQANNVVEVPRDEVMYTMNNIASQLYKTSGRFMRQLYQNGTLGRVLKGDYAEIDQIKAKNEYDHAKPILDEYLNELVWMKYQATEAAQEVINDVISDVEYAIKYYKDLSLGKDVWRTEEKPRFRIVEKQREDVNKGVDSFTSKYNSKPVSVASSDMTDEELEKAVPTLLVEDTRKAIEEGVKGKYSVKADKIYIFADNVNKEELEDTLFHENLHPMFSGNPLIEEFYANFNAKHPEQVKMLAEGYEESEVPEEVFVTNLAVGMQRGNFKMVEPFLAESSREDLYNTLKAFGYDYEQERGRRNPERNSGKGSDVAEGKKVANRSRGKEDSEGQRESSREQAEKLRDLFGRVADMGLDGVLGNEAYDRAMMDIYSVLPEDSRKEVIDDAFNHYGMNIAPAVSDYIHGKSDGNILDKIVAIIRNALRKAGFNIDLNGNEVKYLAWRSKKPLDRNNLVDIAEDIYKKYQLKVGEYSTNDDGTTPDGGGTRFRRVYHGSSASFDKFDHSFMGTGEGNQSFGWGSYVTDVKEVGEKYAGLKADNSPIASQTLRWLDENSTYEAFITKGEGARRKKTIANAKEFLKEMKEDGASEDVINAYEQDLKDAERAITEDGYNQTKENMVASLNRHLYEVEIPDDNGSNYIAWDKMLPKEQAERIKDAIRNSKFFKEYEKDYKQLAEERLDAWTKTNGGRAYKLLGNIVWNEKDLSQILSEAGFAGFKYPTNYFSGGNEDGTNNYVIFNEKDLEIKEHTRFRVTPKMDAEYLEAVNSGNVEKAQKMVSEAARMFGYKYEAYHSSINNFKEFEEGHRGSRPPHSIDDLSPVGWFSKDKQTTYGRVLYHVFIKMEDPLIMSNGSVETIKYEKGEYEKAKEAYENARKEGAAKPVLDKLRKKANQARMFYESSREAFEPFYQLLRDGANALKEDETSKTAGEALRKKYQSFGWDGVILQETIADGNDGATWYIPFKSGSAIKSADAVTYDDNGNVIPLSDRFNPEQKDIRFKVKETKKERIADLRAEISDLKREVTNARKNSQEEWEANQRAIISFIKGKLTKEAGEEFGKYRIDQLLNLVNKATTAKDLRKPFQFIEQVINSAIMDREASRMEKLIKTKLQGETSRGVAKGVVVDESTRRLFDSIRGTFKDLISTSIDSELRHVRSEILRFGKEINDLPADDIQGRTILTARQEALKERRKELEAEQEELRKNNVVETKESLKKRYDELVDAMDAHIDGKGAWTIEMQDEYDSIPLREKLAEIRDAQAQLDDILTDALNTRRAAYGLKGGERKKMLAEADILDSNYSIAQEELIRLMSEVSRDLEEIIKEGKSRLASRREALDERRRKIVSMGIGAVKDRKVIAPNAVLTKEEKWHKWLDNSGLKKFTDFMTAPLNSFNFLLKYIDRNHTIGEGELYNYFMKSQEGALEANNRLYDGLKAYNTAIEEKAKEIFGKSIEEVMKDSGKEYNDRVTKQYMFDSTSHREGERYPIRISKGQALYVWLTWRQEDGRAKLLADGWTEESIAEIEDLIGGDYMKFGEWITDEFFPQLREEKYNKTHIEMFGTSMAKREHYFPFKVNAEDIQEKGEMGESYEGMPSTITGNIIKRTINKSRINTEQNAFDLLYKYGNDMETWNAMAKLRQDLNFLHASKAFRNYMEANSKGLFNTFMKAAEVAVKAYNNSAEANPINDFFVKLNRMWAGSNIGFRLNTAMKQILSYPAFMAYSGNPKFQINLGKYMLNWKGNYDWAKENLPAFRQRIETGDMGMTGMTDPQFDFAKYFKKFTDAGMIPNQLVDALTCAAGARSVYDFEYNQAIKNGLSEEEAKNVAQYNAEVSFNETQQSSREEFVSPIQMSRNVLIKSMMNYQNSNVGYQRMGNEGLLEIMRAKRVYEQDLKNGMNEAEAKKKMANSIARGARKAMVAFTILPGLWYLGGRGIVGITAPLISSLFGGGGDDEPYLDDEAKVGLLVSIGLGTVAGTAGGQLIAGLVQGREYNPMAWMNEMQKDIVGAVNNGWNMNTTKNIALRLAKFGGVNMETWENIYLGAEHAIRTGNFDLVDFMMLINLPASQRKAMAEELYSDMPFMEYADKVSRAQKLFDDYRKYLPYAKTDKNGSKSNAIKKQYIIENLSEEKQDKLEKEKEFKKLQREYGQAEDKAEWLEEHPEYTELEKNFKLQTVTKEVNREAKKLK